MTDRMAAMGETDLIERLRVAASSWRRTDCMIAREVLSEAALLDEAATALEHSAAREAKLRDVLEWSENNCTGKCKGVIAAALGDSNA